MIGSGMLRHSSRALLIGALLLVALGATPAGAGSIDVIFTGSSGAGPCAGGTCTGAAGDVVTANVVLTTAAGDTPLGGPGSGYQISLGYAPVAVGPIAFTSTAPAGWFPAGAGTDDGVGLVTGAFNGIDLFGTSILGQPVSVTIGTITVTLTGAQGALVPTLAGVGDHIVAAGGVDVSHEYNIVPEPGTAMLVALGLAILASTGVRRGSAP